MNNREMLRFRESFRGYNRDDVNSYIEQLNIVFSRREAEYKATISELEEKASAQAEPSVYTHTDAEWDDINSRLVNALAEVEELNRKLAEARKEIETSNDVEKQKMYDSMSSQVGNIIISANNNADKIVSEAKATAEAIKSEASAYADALRLEAETKKAEIISSANKTAKEFSEHCIKEYLALSSDAVKCFNEITDNVKARIDILTYSFDSKRKEIEKRLNQTEG